MMIEVAESAGYCFGVRRAVQMAMDTLSSAHAVATLGPLIHNPHVVDKLQAQGMRTIHDVEQAQEGECVIIRAHGAPPAHRAALAQKKARVIDATCPYVSRIHDVVRTAEIGQTLIVIGEREHPEVLGIIGHAGKDAIIVSGPQEAQALPLIDRALVVVQTTTPCALYEQTCGALRARVGEMRVVDTICRATKERQEAAMALAQRVQAMLIVGSTHSSNTRKLHALCADIVPSYLVDSAREIPWEALKGIRKVGITAGASTPDEIIKEVITRMNDFDSTITQGQTDQEDIQTQEPIGDEGTSFAEAFEKTLVSIKPGQAVVGTVVQVSNDEVCVNIGYKSDGIVPRAELTSQGDPRDHYKSGDEIEVEVVKVNDGEGNVLLSQKNLIALKSWDGLVEKYENKEFVEGVAKSVVKGGLICDVLGVRTFVPASQLAERYVEKIEQFIGQTMKLKIMEVDRSKRRLVASRKAALVEESKKIKDELWQKLAVGQIVQGTVRRLTDFGAFVDVGGMDGLIHVTDLSWGRVKHPSDIVKPDQEIQVEILGLDQERERISLGLKQLQVRPWDNAMVNYPVGSIVEGKVVRMVTFGAFVELEEGLDGLVHISQIANQRIGKVEDELSVGQMVQVKVLDVNPEQKRISLSIREAMGVDTPHDELDELTSLDEAVLAATSQTSTPGITFDDPAAVPVGEGLDEVNSPITGESARNDEAMKDTEEEQ